MGTQGSITIELSWPRLALPVVKAKSRVWMEEPGSEVSPLWVMGRPFPEGQPVAHAPSVPGDASQVELRALTGPVGRRDEKEGTWAAAKSSF